MRVSNLANLDVRRKMEFWHKKRDGLVVVVAEMNRRWVSMHALPKIRAPLTSDVIRYVEDHNIPRVLHGRKEEIIHVHVPIKKQASVTELKQACDRLRTFRLFASHQHHRAV